MCLWIECHAVCNKRMWVSWRVMYNTEEEQRDWILKLVFQVT